MKYWFFTVIVYSSDSLKRFYLTAKIISDKKNEYFPYGQARLSVPSILTNLRDQNILVPSGGINIHIIEHGQIDKEDYNLVCNQISPA